jgi:hypothetical protein
MIARDATSNSGIFFGTSSCDWDHTCTGSDRILFAGLLAATTDLIDVATYNGVPMTLIGKTVAGTDRWVYLFYLVNPPTGTHEISFSNSGFATLDASFGVAASYTGVAQSSPIDDDTTNTALSAPNMTTSVTTTIDDDWTILICRCEGVTLSAGTGSSILFDDDTFSIGLFDSFTSVGAAGSKSMQVTFSPDAPSASTVMAAFKDVSGGGGGPTDPSSSPTDSSLCNSILLGRLIL